jgi:hypothetical protein
MRKGGRPIDGGTAKPGEDPNAALARRNQEANAFVKSLLDDVLDRHNALVEQNKSRTGASSSTLTPVLDSVGSAISAVVSIVPNPRPAREIVPDEAPVTATPVLRAPTPVRVSVPTSASIRAPALAPIGADVSALATAQPDVEDEDEEQELAGWEIEERMARNAYVPPPTARGPGTGSPSMFD